MQAVQKQTQRETLRLFQETPVWSRVSRPQGKTVVGIIGDAVERKRTPALLPKEEMCCNMATD